MSAQQTPQPLMQNPPSPLTPSHQETSGYAATPFIPQPSYQPPQALSPQSSQPIPQVMVPRIDMNTSLPPMPGNMPSEMSLPPGYEEKPSAEPEWPATPKSSAERSAEEEVRKWQAIQNARKSKTDPAWMKPLPDSRGPFLARLEKNPNKQSVSQVSFDMYDKAQEQNKDMYSWEADEKKGFDWMLLDPVTFFQESKKWVGLGPDQKKAEAAMEEARRLMAAEKFHDAAKKFEFAAKRWPDTVLEEDARYFAGECYHMEKEYCKSFENFDRLISNFQSKHKDTAVKRIYEIAGYWTKCQENGASYFNATDKSRPRFDTFGAAVKAYKSITINDPAGPLSDESMLQLGFAYMNQGKNQGDKQFTDAAFWFQQLREHARKQEYVSRACYLEVYCRRLAGDGAEYNAAPLESAKVLADQTLNQYGTALKEDRTKLVEIRDDILEDAANHRWALGQYYEKQKYYAAARLEYQRILKEYPATQLAGRAEQRLTEIGGFPDEPPTIAQGIKSRIPFLAKAKSEESGEVRVR
ncbi:MAG: tetratricopeptide repeat protein [Planctomycetaceae bacterium]|nr:tetratricopeptide repeat protein [Planctomycetaceae bacterium]